MVCTGAQRQTGEQSDLFLGHSMKYFRRIITKYFQTDDQQDLDSHCPGSGRTIISTWQTEEQSTGQVDDEVWS